MRLLNTTTLRFEQVPDSELGLERNRYAILSHRWGSEEDEVLYEDIQSLPSEELHRKKGYAKIEAFCQFASLIECRYGWVDTCCINRGNSSELSEAINSMYLWYSNSNVCVAYLKDVPLVAFADSEWFARGWTLQELIAPRAVSFFDNTWSLIGTKTDLLSNLSSITGIPEKVLSHVQRPSDYSVAQRFSWAATRKTTRIEDRAYSLMGLFDVNMPMIYGEREKAFLRLQQHIMQSCDDESLFAWTMGISDHNGVHGCSGPYAPSPSNFADCINVVQTSGSHGFSEMNGKLSIRLPIQRYSRGVLTAWLSCSHHTSDADRGVGILIASTSKGDEYVRVMDPNGTSLKTRSRPLENSAQEPLIRVPTHPADLQLDLFGMYGFWLRTIQPVGFIDSSITILSNMVVDQASFVFSHRCDPHITGIVRLASKQPWDRTDGWFRICWILFGFGADGLPIIWLANDSHSEILERQYDRALTCPVSGFDFDVVQDIFGRDVETKICPASRTEGRFLSQLDWLAGRAVICGAYSQHKAFSILEGRVRISVRPWYPESPTLIARRADPNDKRDKHSLPIERLWVVDITVPDGISPIDGSRNKSLLMGFKNIDKQLHKKADLSNVAVEARKVPVVQILE